MPFFVCKVNEEAEAKSTSHFETKLKIIADSEAGKQAIDIRCNMEYCLQQ